MIRPRGLWLRRTMRFRITTIATAVTLAVLLGIALLSSRMIAGLLVQSADDELGPALSAATAQVTRGVVTVSGSPNIQVHVLDTAGAPVDGGLAPQLAPADVRVLKAGTPVLRVGDSPPARWQGTVVTAPDGSQRLVVVGTGLAGYTAAQGHALRWLLVAAGIAALAAALATYLAVRSALRPVERMRTAAAQLGAGKRLPLPESHDELRSLAGALNALLARRDEAADRLRRFTGDAAHELRSPVASIRVQAEVAVAHPDPDLAQEVLTDVMRESERLSALVDGLLTLARSDAGELPTAEPVDLSAAAVDAAARCPDDGPAVVVHAPAGSCWVLAAPSEVDLVLDNLLRNAFRHTRTRVTVTVLAGGTVGRLVVDDDGDGIPAEHRAKVFDRFYRVQDDRARSSGGTGLGLALVAEVVRRRGGTVRVGESPEGGARLLVAWRTTATPSSLT
ncbi:HAMP domain-containing sensor histidine kinase [Actinokineospora sp. NBRC 105648]|uniref:sensor histidine kinase n=1 Tax=Actinokineospora sp. NBRC 105648 TaxID=3032206 RepID=UPI0024A16398|nr:HAMP domain-containing sensor histidine kinase [Actinokineospora sp. NBRC 105648]GLZ41188.1 two-component sensor histidine kinase [Actinokineospora sp. NBRC 105648]